MIVVRTVSDLRQHLNQMRAARRRIAFVPTMGNLHPGHLRLVTQANNHADSVVASIFVNPLQFGPNEDFDRYPRTPDEDIALLEAVGAELVFLPEVSEMYPRPLEQMTTVAVPGLSTILCGASRPNHFQGVTTVVNRLFNLVQPDLAVFGKKDYQQLVIIRRMVEDLGIPVELMGVDTVREDDHLAMSSRNRYLSETEREIAPQLYATLDSIRSLVLSQGEVPGDVETQGKKRLAAAGFAPEYVSVRRRQDLASPRPGDTGLVVLAAARLGQTRLIDNLEFDLNTGA